MRNTCCGDGCDQGDCSGDDNTVMHESMATVVVVAMTIMLSLETSFGLETNFSGLALVSSGFGLESSDQILVLNNSRPLLGSVTLSYSNELSD